MQPLYAAVSRARLGFRGGSNDFLVVTAHPGNLRLKDRRITPRAPPFECTSVRGCGALDIQA